MSGDCVRAVHTKRAKWDFAFHVQGSHFKSSPDTCFTSLTDEITCVLAFQISSFFTEALNISRILYIYVFVQVLA